MVSGNSGNMEQPKKTWMNCVKKKSEVKISVQSGMNIISGMGTEDYAFTDLNMRTGRWRLL